MNVVRLNICYGDLLAVIFFGVESVEIGWVTWLICTFQLIITTLFGRCTQVFPTFGHRHLISSL